MRYSFHQSDIAFLLPAKTSRSPIDNASWFHPVDSMQWRAKFLIVIAKRVFLPAIVIKCILWYYGVQLSPLAQFGLFIFATLGYINLCSRWDQYRISRDALRLNARTVPVARGKWPLNLDLLVRLSRAPKTAYAAAWMHDLFQEYQTNTLNIRPLGMDLILTCDHAIIKEMLTSGFGNWEKGPTLRKMLFDFLGAGIFAVDGEDWKAVSGLGLKVQALMAV